MAPLAFFGTPEFAVPPLEALSAADRTPALVVSQPSRPAGRGHQPRLPPVARRARERGLPSLQPERVRAPEVLPGPAALRPPGPVVRRVPHELPPEPRRPPAD